MRSRSLLFWNTSDRGSARGRASSLSRFFGSSEDDGGDDDDGDDDDERTERTRLLNNYIINPRKTHVQRMTETWHSRLLSLVIFPSLVALVWCAIPLSTYDLLGGATGRHVEGFNVGSSPARINIWQFLFIYYGLYTAIGIGLLGCFLLTKIRRTAVDH